MIWFEDFAPGQVRRWGRIEVTAAEASMFIARFDPAPWMTGPEAMAEASDRAGFASPLHVASIAMRLRCECFLLDSASMGSPGLTEVRWPVAVRVGDWLSIRVTAETVRPSASRPDRGTVTFLDETLNQHGEVVLSTRPTILFGRRPPA